jgi:hypothetical protein
LGDLDQTAPKVCQGGGKANVVAVMLAQGGVDFAHAGSRFVGSREFPEPLGHRRRFRCGGKFRNGRTPLHDGRAGADAEQEPLESDGGGEVCGGLGLRGVELRQRGGEIGLGDACAVLPNGWRRLRGEQAGGGEAEAGGQAHGGRRIGKAGKGKARAGLGNREMCWVCEDCGGRKRRDVG